MLTINQVLHYIRYNFDVLRINYRHHRYNQNKNPRVITGRLPNERLVSLRTNPHDKYFLGKGEFFGFSGTFIDEDEQDHEEDCVCCGDEPYRQHRLIHEIESMVDVSSCGAIDANQDEEGSVIRYIQSAPDVPTFNRSLTSINITMMGDGIRCDCSCHNIHKYRSVGENPYSGIDLDERAVSRADSTASCKAVVPQIYDIFNWRKKKKRGLHKKTANIPSPIIELNSSPANEAVLSPICPIPIKLKNNDILESPCINPKIPSFRQSSTETKATYSSVLSDYHSQLLHHFEDKTPSTVCNCQRCTRKRGVIQEGVWKTVLNEISLSAARISTGNMSKSRSFANLTSDFIGVKYERSDELRETSLNKPRGSKRKKGELKDSEIVHLNENRERPITCMSEPLPDLEDDLIQISPGYSGIFANYYSNTEAGDSTKIWRDSKRLEGESRESLNLQRDEGENWLYQYKGRSK